MRPASRRCTGRAHAYGRPALFALLVASCFRPEAEARRRAVDDLSCPADQVTITATQNEIDGGKEYVAEGCGRRLSYSCGSRGPRHYGYVCTRVWAPVRPSRRYRVFPVYGPGPPRAHVEAVP